MRMHQLTGYDIFNRFHTFRTSYGLTGKPLSSLNISKDMKGISFRATLRLIRTC